MVKINIKLPIGYTSDDIKETVYEFKRETKEFKGWGKTKKVL